MGVDVGARIRKTRIERGIKVEDLAKALGVSPSTIYRYENGEINENRPDASRAACSESFRKRCGDERKRDEQ